MISEHPEPFVLKILLGIMYCRLVNKYVKILIGKLWLVSLNMWQVFSCKLLKWVSYGRKIIDAIYDLKRGQFCGVKFNWQSCSLRDTSNPYRNRSEFQLLHLHQLPAKAAGEGAAHLLPVWEPTLLQFHVLGLVQTRPMQPLGDWPRVQSFILSLQIFLLNKTNKSLQISSKNQ